jgi:hypothetical protein
MIAERNSEVNTSAIGDDPYYDERGPKERADV